MTIERNAQKGYGEQERNVHHTGATLLVALIDAPNQYGCQHDDIDNDARIEEQLEPAAYFGNTWHDAIEHGGYQDGRGHQSEDGSPSSGIRCLLVIIDQYDGWEAEQIQQVHTDAQACEVSYEDEPTPAIRLIGHVFPFQYQPEYHGGKQRGEGIDFTFYCTEPECITETIGKSTYQSATDNDHNLWRTDMVLSFSGDQLPYEVGNGPEKEHDAGATHQGAHVVDHTGHLGSITGKL